MEDQKKNFEKLNEKNVLGKMSNKVKNKNGLAALSYLWILCIIPLLASKDEFVKFHARQGVILFLIELVLSLIAWIPLVGWLASLMVVIVCVIGIIKALNGEKWEIPYIYDWSKKIKI